MATEKDKEIINVFLSQGRGHYYLNIVCRNPEYNRNYEIPQKIIHQLLTAKLRRYRKYLEKFGEEKDYEKFVEVFGEGRVVEGGGLMASEKEPAKVSEEFIIYEDGNFALILQNDDADEFQAKWRRYEKLIDAYVSLVREEGEA